MESDGEIMKALPVQLIETRGGVILKRGRTVFKVEGERAAEVIARILNMTFRDATREEICGTFAAPDRPAVADLLTQLERRHILFSTDDREDFTGGPETPLDVFLWHFGETAPSMLARLNQQRIAVVGVNYVSRQMAKSLAATGLKSLQVFDQPRFRNLNLFQQDGRLREEQWSFDLEPPHPLPEGPADLDPDLFDCIVATSDFGGMEFMREWNEWCVRRRRHFLPVVLQDLVGYIGPLVIPGETPCFECLRARQNACLPDPETQRLVESFAYEGQAIAGFHPSMASVLGDIAAIELCKLYGGWHTVSNLGKLIEVNLLATRLETRRVLRIPRCAVCGALNERATFKVEKGVSPLEWEE